MNKKEQIKYAVEQLIEQGNLEIVDTVFAIDYIAHTENKTYSGQEFIKRYSKILHTSIPDISVLKIEFFVEENNTISWQRTLQGTHRKNMMGIPASHKKIQWNEMVVTIFDEVKIAEEWIVSELMGQLLLQTQTK